MLAADESASSIESRLTNFKIENTPENRHKFRQLLITTHGISNMLGGIILNEETFDQKADNGELFVQILKNRGIAPGIKLDKGLIDFKSNEKVSVGLEDLEKRLGHEIYKFAEFAKFRSVFSISKSTPTEECIHENCKVLAQYAEICQRHGIVPIVEPEILFEGKFTIEECVQVTKTVLACLMFHLNFNDVYMPGILVKPSFVTPGKEIFSYSTSIVNDVAMSTFACLLDTIPVGVPGIVFLSGGHSARDATLFLNAVNKQSGRRTFALSFSYGRALNDPVLEVWRGDEKNIVAAQKVFKERLTETYLAAKGEYESSKEH